MLKFFLGIASIVVGLWMVLFVFAFATMVDPRLQGREWWSAVLVQYRSHGEAWVVTFLGLILAAGGSSLCVRIWRQAGRTRPPNEAIQRTRLPAGR